jgi:TonB family protein
MGDPVSPDSSRGYARPGEIALSDLEVRPAELRPGAAPIPNRISPTHPAGKDTINTINTLNTFSQPKPSNPPKLTIPPNPTNTTNLPKLSIPPNPTNTTNLPKLSIPPNPANASNPPKLTIPTNPTRPANPIYRTNTVNTKFVSARFELLPERKPQWNRIGISAAAQLAALGLLLLSPLIFPQRMQTALKFDVVELMQPVTQIQIPSRTPPPPPKVRPKVPPPEPKPEVPEPVVLNPKQPHVFVVTKPELPKFRTVEAKPLDLNPIFKETKITIETSQPARPKEDVKVANLNSGSPAPVTVVAPLNKVQTGGFGDPNGIAGPGNPNRGANINQAGSPLLPGGPGYGNGSGGARGIRGTAAAAESKPNGVAAGGGNSRVDILNKPNPVYSSDGRALRIEGDVVLEVIFLASGQMEVVRVVSGLGHGLDEAAIQAAKQIRFRPAKHDGQPIDFPARVRIAFRLAG